MFSLDPGIEMEKEIGKIMINKEEYKLYPLSSGRVQFEGPHANILFNCRDMTNLNNALNYYLDLEDANAKGCECGARQTECSCL